MRLPAAPCKIKERSVKTMDFQKVHGCPRPVRIRLQGSEPGTVCQSFLGIKNAASYKTMRQKRKSPR